MDFLAHLGEALMENWTIWMVSAVLVVAAVIDGLQLKVPNWLTYPLVISGWIYSTTCFGLEGLGWSLLGTALGLALLLPAYAIGGMGAGDVKLLAGVGAWVYCTHTLLAFGISAVIGGLMAIVMVCWSGKWRKHLAQFQVIAGEIMTIRDPEKLSAIAAERKSSMMLLPYGIPITIGTILYFAWNGMLI
jgi:prepilin peptidase CpaA